MDDEHLIASVAAGDDMALRELFVRHAPWLAARLRAVLPAADVEDVLQETFLAVWRGAARYRPEGPGTAAGGWLWAIARRQAALLLRRRGPAAAALPAVLLPAGPDAADPAEAVLSRADLDEAVAVLGPHGGPEREVWRLVYVEDRPVAEVAELMGVPVGTVKSRAPVLAEGAGLPGAPVRATQVAAADATGPGGPPEAITLGGHPAVLRMSLGSLDMPGPCGFCGGPVAAKQFTGQMRLMFAQVFVGTGNGSGSPVQRAVLAALLRDAGIPFATQSALMATKDGPGSQPGAATGPVYAAAQRFARLPAAARHASG